MRLAVPAAFEKIEIPGSVPDELRQRTEKLPGVTLTTVTFEMEMPDAVQAQKSDAARQMSNALQRLRVRLRLRLGANISAHLLVTPGGRLIGTVVPVDRCKPGSPCRARIDSPPARMAKRCVPLALRAAAMACAAPSPLSINTSNGGALAPEPD